MSIKPKQLSKSKNSVHLVVCIDFFTHLNPIFCHPYLLHFHAYQNIHLPSFFTFFYLAFSVSFLSTSYLQFFIPSSIPSLPRSSLSLPLIPLFQYLLCSSLCLSSLILISQIFLAKFLSTLRSSSPYSRYRPCL